MMFFFGSGHLRELRLAGRRRTGAEEEASVIELPQGESEDELLAGESGDSGSRRGGSGSVPEPSSEVSGEGVANSEKRLNASQYCA